MSDLLRKELIVIRAEAVKAIGAVGAKTRDLRNFKAVVALGTVAFVGPLPEPIQRQISSDPPPHDSLSVVDYADPIQAPLDPNVILGYAGAMLFACCEYVRESPPLSDRYTQLVVGQAIGRLRLAIQAPGVRMQVLRPYMTHIFLGTSRRKQMKDFAKRHAADLHNERAKEWEKWQAERDRIVKLNPELESNKSELSRRIKKNLNLPDSVRAIRNRI